MKAELARFRRKGFADRLSMFAFVLHLFAGAMVLLWSIKSPQTLARSPLLALLADTANNIFGVVENAYLCKPVTAAGIAIVATITYSSHFLLVALIVRDRKIITSEDGWSRCTLGDKARLWLMGLFGMFFYLFTFYWMGGPDSTPGYNVLCLRPIKLWLLWTIQTLVSVVLIHICLGPIYQLLYLTARKLRLAKG